MSNSKKTKCEQRGNHVYLRTNVKVGNVVHVFRKCKHCGVSFEVPAKEL